MVMVQRFITYRFAIVLWRVNQLLLKVLEATGSIKLIDIF